MRTAVLALFLVACGRAASPPPVAPAPPPRPAEAEPTETKPSYSPGLEVVDTKIGSGPACKAGDTIRVRYVGRLDDGTIFDQNESASFPIGKGVLIKGWDEGVPGMRVGGVRNLTIPASLGYGTKGAPPKIPPFATLHFEIELLAIE